MRDWELVLYKYANVNVLESSALSVRARTTRCLSQPEDVFSIHFLKQWIIVNVFQSPESSHLEGVALRVAARNSTLRPNILILLLPLEFQRN